MAVTAKSRPMTTLYSSSNCPDCHRIRFVLAIKGINVEILDMDTTPSAEADLALPAHWYLEHSRKAGQVRYHLARAAGDGQNLESEGGGND